MANGMQRVPIDPYGAAVRHEAAVSQPMPKRLEGTLGGAILRGLFGGTGVGNVLASVGTHQQRESLAEESEQVAKHIEGYGTDGAKEFAQQLRKNPSLAHRMAMQAGGWPAKIKMLEAEAAGVRKGEAYRKWAAVTPIEEQHSQNLFDWALARGMSYEDAKALAAQKKAMRPGSEGIVITEDEEGRQTIRIGGPAKAGGGITPSTQTKAEDAIRNAFGSMERMREIESTVQPKDLTYWKKWDMLRAEEKEKLGFQLDTAEAAALDRYSDLKQNTLQELTFMIKAISGAQVAEWELEQIKAFMPDMDDSYTVFMSAVRRVKRGSARIIARENLIRRGVVTADHPLYAIDRIVKKRHRENTNKIIEANLGMDPHEAERRSEQMIVQEFGAYYKDIMGIRPKPPGSE